MKNSISFLLTLPPSPPHSRVPSKPSAPPSTPSLPSTSQLAARQLSVLKHGDLPACVKATIKEMLHEAIVVDLDHDTIEEKGMEPSMTTLPPLPGMFRCRSKCVVSVDFSKPMHVGQTSHQFSPRLHRPKTDIASLFDVYRGAFSFLSFESF